MTLAPLPADKHVITWQDNMTSTMANPEVRTIVRVRDNGDVEVYAGHEPILVKPGDEVVIDTVMPCQPYTNVFRHTVYLVKPLETEGGK
jgi:hypothetical protein